jgi:hypothetical protein
MESKDPVVNVKVVCGCGSIFEAHGEQAIVSMMAKARDHADKRRHTLEVRGEIRVEKAPTVVPRDVRR